MKDFYGYFIGLMLLVLVLLAATGCQHLERGFLKPVVTQMQEERVVGTNIVEIAPGTFETNAVKELVWVNQTNYVPNAFLTGTVDMVASNVGIPGGGLIGGIFATILTGIGGWVTARRNDRKTIESLVEGVESGRAELGRVLEEAAAKGEVPDKSSADARILGAMKQVHKHTGHVDKIRKVVRFVRAKTQ